MDYDKQTDRRFREQTRSTEMKEKNRKGGRRGRVLNSFVVTWACDPTAGGGKGEEVERRRGQLSGVCPAGGGRRVKVMRREISRPAFRKSVTAGLKVRGQDHVTNRQHGVCPM
eukprot:764462-Hanusia_phi.AAC.2